MAVKNGNNYYFRIIYVILSITDAVIGNTIQSKLTLGPILDGKKYIFRHKKGSIHKIIARYVLIIIAKILQVDS